MPPEVQKLLQTNGKRPPSTVGITQLVKKVTTFYGT